MLTNLLAMHKFTSFNWKVSEMKFCAQKQEESSPHCVPVIERKSFAKIVKKPQHCVPYNVLLCIKAATKSFAQFIYTDFYQVFPQSKILIFLHRNINIWATSSKGNNLATMNACAKFSFFWGQLSLIFAISSLTES